MSQGEATKQKGGKGKKLMLVRYGRLGYLGWFEHNLNRMPKRYSQVVIKTKRGLEIGELVGPFSYRGGDFKSSGKQVAEYFSNSPHRDYPMTEGGTFVRFATPDDLMEEEHLKASAQEELKCCERFAKEMELGMKVIDAEHLFGGERIVIYFTSDGRVDFRELVRRLAREYQTRIELRQVGSRDGARLISDFESCGQECCCRRFLKILAPVSMRMAKLQKATLDPSKISGHCGRLKCCLRYEDETYKDLKERLPKKNALVKTPTGTGRVIEVQVLTQLIVVQDDEGKREAFGIEDIEIIDDTEGVEETDVLEVDEETEKAIKELEEADMKEVGTVEKDSGGEVAGKSDKDIQNQDRGGNKRRRGKRWWGKKPGNKDGNQHQPKEE